MRCLQSAPQPCTQETQGLLYFDLSSSKMYRCRQREWQEWDWGRGRGTSSSRTAARRRQQSSVRRAASMPDSSSADSSVCPTGTQIGRFSLAIAARQPLFYGVLAQLAELFI